MGADPSRPVRVLFVIPGEPRGCSMICARRQAETLSTAGVEVFSACLRSRTSPLALWRDFLRFRKEMRRIRPDVVHAHFGTMTAMFAAVAAAGRPLVITYRGSDLNLLPGCRAALGHLLSQLAALRAARIICVSRKLRARLWWRQSRAIVIPTGVDPEIFYPESRSMARRQLGWTHTEPVVLFNAGYDHQIKRLDLAQAALAAARRTIPELRLEILDGNVEPGLVPALMNAADCLLLTSDTEGSPAVLQEALACNLPIVSVDVGDAAERVDGVRHARIVARDAESLGKALKNMVRQPLRSDGRLKLDEFSAPQIALQLRDMYRGLCYRSW
jgi:teichuronic acid biosynthesis glycosyltransferase TuaC